MQICALKFYRENFSFPVVNFYRKVSLPHQGYEFNEISKKFITRYREKWMKCSLQENTLDILKHLQNLDIRQMILSAGNQYDVEKFVKHYVLGCIQKMDKNRVLKCILYKNQ